MNVVPLPRGLALLAAHCAALDPDAATARDRLDEAVGPELAQKLVFALTATGTDRTRVRTVLGARPLFAA